MVLPLCGEAETHVLEVGTKFGNRSVKLKLQDLDIEAVDEREDVKDFAVKVAILSLGWVLALSLFPWRALAAKWKAFRAIQEWKAFTHGKVFWQMDYSQPKFVPKLEIIPEEFENPEDKIAMLREELLSRLDTVVEQLGGRLTLVEEEQQTLSNSFSAKLQLDEQLKIEQTERLSATEEVLQGIQENTKVVEPLQNIENMLNALLEEKLDMAVLDLQRQIEKQINNLTQWEDAQTQRLTMDLKRDLRQEWDAFAAQVQRQGDELRRESELKIQSLVKRHSPGKKVLPKTRGKIGEYQHEVIRYPCT